MHANTIYTAINLCKPYICFFFLHVKISPFSFMQLTIPKVSKFVCYIAFFVGNNFMMIYNKIIGTGTITIYITSVERVIINYKFGIGWTNETDLCIVLERGTEARDSLGVRETIKLAMHC